MEDMFHATVRVISASSLTC